MKSFYYRAIESEVWEKVMAFFVKETRTNDSGNANPSYALIESQSVKTVYHAENRGFDGEKTKGRKRHIVTDIMGNILAVHIHAANIHDTKGGCYVFAKALDLLRNLG